MPKVNYSDLEDAFLFADADFEGEDTAYISWKTGKIYWVSDDGEFEPLPDDFYESEKYLPIPNRMDLDLGTELVKDFAATLSEELQDQIREAFRSRGAYSRFKRLLDQNGILADWYQYESQRQKEAICDWCKVHGIELENEEPAA